MERYGAIESVLRAEIVELEAALDAEREKVKELEEQLRLANCDQVNTENDLNDVTSQLAALQAQLAEKDRHGTENRVVIRKVHDGYIIELLDYPLAYTFDTQDQAERFVEQVWQRLDYIAQAKDAEIAALKEHQKLHDRIFERQKLLLSHYAGTIKEAAKRLRYSTHSIEQPEPYNSRTPIVAAFLEQALGVNAEELEKERDTLTHTNARLREALKTIEAIICDKKLCGHFLAEEIREQTQQALADTEGQEGA